MLYCRQTRTVILQLCIFERYIMELNKKQLLGALFAQLEAGDGLCVTTINDTGATEVIQVSVLRREGDNLYLAPGRRDGQWGMQPLLQGPFAFDEETGFVYDRDGNIAEWLVYDNLQYEKAVALDAAERYAQIPRLEHVTVTLDNAILEEMDTQIYHVLAAIIAHGEAGSLDTQLSLTLDMIGLPHTAEQLGALLFFLQASQDYNYHTMASASMVSPHPCAGADEGNADATDSSKKC